MLVTGQSKAAEYGDNRHDKQQLDESETRTGATVQMSG
jgi:hypothetical protein